MARAIRIKFGKSLPPELRECGYNMGDRALVVGDDRTPEHHADDQRKQNADYSVTDKSCHAATAHQKIGANTRDKEKRRQAPRVQDKDDEFWCVAADVLVSIPINIGAVTNEPDQRVIGHKDAK